MSDDAGPLYGPGLEAPEGILLELASGPYYVTVVPLLFGAARLGITSLDDLFRVEGFRRGYDYTTAIEAITAAVLWDPETSPEPDGWVRCLDDGRRRPDGDASKEYVHA
jgi:hypothetical protein